MSNEQDNKAFLPEGQKPIESSSTTTTTTTAITAADSSSSSSSGAADEYLDKLRKENDKKYVDNVVAMSDQKEFKITLNIPDPSGKTETLEFGDEKIVQPIYIGTEDRPYQTHPITPQEFKLIEKFRARFDNEKKPDRDKIVDNQIALYRFMASRFLKMPGEDFDRVADWTQLKMVVDASEYKALYKPHRK